MAAPRTAAGSRTAPNTLVVCFLIAALEGFDIQSMGVVAPKMAPALHLGPEAAGAVFSASLVGMIGGAVVGGWLADRRGHRLVLICAMAMFGVFTLLSAAAPPLAPLLFVRCAVGLGLGAALPSLLAIAAATAPDDKRTAIVTCMSAGIPLGAAFAAVVGRFWLSVDWRLIFMIGGAAPLILAVIACYALPPGALPQRAGAAIPVTILGRALWKTTALLCVSYAFVLMSLLMLMNWLPLLLTRSGLSVNAASFLTIVFNAGGVVGGLALGQAISRYGRRSVTLVSFSTLIVVLLILGLVQADGTMVTLLLFAAGFLLMGGQCLLYGVAASTYPAEIRARGLGASIASGRIGAVAGPLLAGLLVANGAGVGGVMLSTAGLVAIGAVAVAAVVMGKSGHSDARDAKPVEN